MTKQELASIFESIIINNVTGSDWGGVFGTATAASIMADLVWPMFQVEAKIQ